MKRKVLILTIIMFICAGLCAACAGGDPPACAPYGSIAPTAPSNLADPPLGASPMPTSSSPTMTMAPPPTLLPTCTPAHPTNTPRPTQVYARPPINVATAPQNLTLSPGGELIGHAVAAPGAIAVTWQRGEQSRVSVRTGLGWREFAAPPGVSGELSVALSPVGRTHVLGAGGQYALSDDGQTWAEAITVLPAGHSPRLLLQSDGFVRAFILSDETLYTALQASDHWSAPEALDGSIVSYDVTREGEQEWVAATGAGGTRVYLDGQQVASWAGASFVSITVRDGRAVVGMGGQHRAAVAWQLEAGGAWTTCPIQEITVGDWSGKARIGEVYGVPAWRQEQVVVLWTWWQPGHDNRGERPYIVISHTPETACDPFPALHDAQNLYPQFAGPPGLFATLSPQARMSLDLQGERGVIAFEGLQWNGNRDVYVAEFHPDTILSGGVQ